MIWCSGSEHLSVNLPFCSERSEVDQQILSFTWYICQYICTSHIPKSLFCLQNVLPLEKINQCFLFVPFPFPLSKSLMSSCCVLGAEVAHKKLRTSIGHSLVCYSQYEVALLLLFLIPALPFRVSSFSVLISCKHIHVHLVHNFFRISLGLLSFISFYSHPKFLFFFLSFFVFSHAY